MSLWKTVRKTVPCGWIGVSILVFVDVALKGSFMIRYIASKQVSILVFVDVALKVENMEGVTNSKTVSILVFVDVALKGCPSLPNVKVRVFQSLFSWMSLWKTIAINYSIVVRIGFNPCFGGCRSERLQRSNSHVGTLCFNPCFGGCRSESSAAWLPVFW